MVTACRGASSWPSSLEMRIEEHRRRRNGRGGQLVNTHGEVFTAVMAHRCRCRSCTDRWPGAECSATTANLWISCSRWGGCRAC